MYKPVALACGHISCFWCVFKAMDIFHESHCPLCRKSYNHFPRICELLHFLLLKLYPLSYEKKGKQVAEEEKRRGHKSPQFDDKSIDSQFCGVLNPQHYPSPQEAVSIQSNAMCGADRSHVQDPSKRMLHDGESTANIAVMSSSQDANFVVEHSKQDLAADLQCAVCKRLSCCPVVLNCGHEEEKRRGHKSPQFDDKSIDSQFCGVLNPQHYPSPQEAVSIQSNAMCGADRSHVQDPSKRMLHDGESTANIAVMSSSQEANFVVEHSKQDLAADLQCAVCKRLLCCPVVLNCGHVFCEACIDPHDSACKCPKCQSAHPNGFPNVCLVLEHFLEEHFPEEYSARKESLQNFQSANPSQGSSEKQEQAAQGSSVVKNVFSSWFSEHEPKFHLGVGCDHCGMYPIIGKRYKCRDCVEEIGFDLCESCYNSSSKLPGRFNQQHTQEHQFVLLETPQNIILSVGAEHPEDYEVSAVLSLGAEHPEGYEVSAGNTDNPEEVVTASYLSNDASEDELEIATSANSLYNDPLDLENDAIARPNSSHNRSEDQYGDSAT